MPRFVNPLVDRTPLALTVQAIVARRRRASVARAVAVLSAAALAIAPAPAAAQGKGAGSSLFAPGYMDLGPTIGLGGIGEAGIAFGGRFERAIKRLPDLGNGVLGIQVSADIWNYNNRYVGTDYDFRYLNLGVTANYHFEVKGNPKLDPFLGLGLGKSSVSTDFAGDYSSGVYFIGRAVIRYFYKPRLALYADVGAGASTLNEGVTFGLGSGNK
ncbi:MAG: hypothetical protein IPN16_21135 [Gemmatimonadetes bacterium]|nr:hypothetical protein [Gemmatimonadota bacterium]